MFLSVVSLHSFQAKNYEHLKTACPKLGSEVLDIHFKLYRGYVNQTNKLQAYLQENPAASTFIYASIKRRYAWEYDSMMLHELYFDNLGGNGRLEKDTDLYRALTMQYGSMDKWMADLKATARTRGIGWVILYYNPQTKMFTNAWIQDHDKGLLVCEMPILVIDLWEHAYLCQFGLDRIGYVDTVLEYLDFDEINQRFERAEMMSPDKSMHRSKDRSMEMSEE